MVREHYNERGKMLYVSIHQRNVLLILLVYWFLQNLDKDQRKKQVEKFIKIIYIFLMKFCKFTFGK